MAEVLITLAIIGVVAACTIPSVIHNYQKRQIEVKLKKVYTELSQAINRSIADNGSMDKWDFSSSYGASGQGNVDFIDRFLAPYLKIQKNCIKNYNKKNCPTHTVKNMNGTSSSLAFNSSYHLTLNGGTMISFFNNPNHGYLYMFVDINGEKGPDKMGIDVFYFSTGSGRFATKRLMLAGETDYTNKYTASICSKQGNGDYCGAMIQRNGWKIPTKDEYVNKFKGKAEDYPW